MLENRYKKFFRSGEGTRDSRVGGMGRVSSSVLY